MFILHGHINCFHFWECKEMMVMVEVVVVVGVLGAVEGRCEEASGTVCIPQRLIDGCRGQRAEEPGASLAS